ncbi:MAG: aspartate 1-decarboxylase [Candidatus Njordarchaeales archaeon]
MLKRILNTKIQGLRVTGKDLRYLGSLTIDKNLLEMAGIAPYEIVLVANLSNGQRFETYVIPGKKGEVILNGAAARLGEVGDELIVFSFVYADLNEVSKVKPKIIIVNENNEPVQVFHY